jgi:hypothetical protein
VMTEDRSSVDGRDVVPEGSRLFEGSCSWDGKEVPEGSWSRVWF